MNRFSKYFLLLMAGILVLASCSRDKNLTPISKGEANFSYYVALGNSLTSGYADNALYYAGQMVSYPNLMATQFRQVGGGPFRQPLVNPNSVGIGGSLNSKLILKVVDGELMPVPAAPYGDIAIFTNSVAADGPFNNMGVPGATVTTAVIPGYGNPANGIGNYNPFFMRMTKDPTINSMLGDAMAQKPTFFTVFLGSNDVLGYATEGGVGATITPMQGAVGLGFAASYEAIIDSMTSNAAKGAVANIPDVTTAPFFTTIPYNGLVLTTENGVSALNASYSQLIAAGLVAPFKLGSNGFIIVDASSPFGARQMKPGELVLLTTPQDSLKHAGWGSSKAIPDQYILTAAEINKIREATNAFNMEIKSVAVTKGLAYVDVAALLQKLKSPGIEVNGRLVSSSFITGGAFSLDGIHLTPLGNALLANEFLKTINATYHAFVPLVDPSGYGGVKFP